MANNFPNCIKQRVQVTPSPSIQVLSHVWEWNDDGTPIFQDLERQNARHLPASLLQSNFAQTEAGRQFVNWMQQDQPNNEPYVVNCRAQGQVNTVRKSLLGMVYQGDVKKIMVDHHVDGIQFSKLDYDIPLMEYDPPDGSYPFQNITTRRKGCLDLIQDINFNALRGTPGPGTYPCRQGNCKETGPCTSQSAVVQWGPEPGQSININRRLTCDCDNLVYLLHCNACLEEGTWTTYVGESESYRNLEDRTRTFHHRISAHLSQLSDQGNRDRFPIDDNFPELILGFVEGNPDVHRDPYVHFNHLHTREDRRITVLETGFSSQRERRRAEYLWQIQIGNYNYNPVTFTGSLNK